MRPLFIHLMIWLPLTGLPLLGIGLLQLMRFLRDVPTIESDAHLTQLQTLAGRQMILALIQIPVLFSPWVAFIVGLVRKDLTLADALYSTASFVVVLAAGLLVKIPEKRVHSVPTATLDLQADRDHIVDVWLHKALPTWKNH